MTHSILAAMVCGLAIAMMQAAAYIDPKYSGQPVPLAPVAVSFIMGFLISLSCDRLFKK